MEKEIKRELIKEVNSYSPYHDTWKIIRYYDVVTEEPLDEPHVHNSLLKETPE